MNQIVTLQELFEQQAGEGVEVESPVEPDVAAVGGIDGVRHAVALEGLVEGLHRVGGVRAGLGVIAGRGQPHLGEGGASLRCTSGSLGGLCRRRGLL